MNTHIEPNPHRRVEPGRTFCWHNDGRKFKIVSVGPSLVGYRIDKEKETRFATRFAFGSWIGKHLLVPVREGARA